MASDMAQYQEARGYAIGGNTLADSAAKASFTRLMARSDSLDRARSKVADTKKLTNHAAHGDSVSFPPSMKTQRMKRYGC